MENFGSPMATTNYVQGSFGMQQSHFNMIIYLMAKFGNQLGKQSSQLT